MFLLSARPAGGGWRTACTCPTCPCSAGGSGRRTWARPWVASLPADQVTRVARVPVDRHRHPPDDDDRRGGQIALGGHVQEEGVQTPWHPCASVAMTDTDSRPTSTEPGVPAKRERLGSNLSHAGSGEPSSSVALIDERVAMCRCPASVNMSVRAGPARTAGPDGRQLVGCRLGHEGHVVDVIDRDGEACPRCPAPALSVAVTVTTGCPHPRRAGCR